MTASSPPRFQAPAARRNALGTLSYDDQLSSRLFVYGKVRDGVRSEALITAQTTLLTLRDEGKIEILRDRAPRFMQGKV